MNDHGKIAKPPLFVGLNLPARREAAVSADSQVVESALQKGYDMITSKITSRSYRKRIQSLFQELEQNDSPLIGSSSSSSTPTLSDIVQCGIETEVPIPEVDDLVSHPGNHISNTIALASSWVELDSKDPRVANLSLQVLQHELNYASFCGLSYVLIAGPKRRTNLTQYSQAINSLLESIPFVQLVIHLTFREESSTRNSTAPSSLGSNNDELSIWEVWNTIRTICHYPSNLSIALQLPASVPPSHVISRWFAEPVSMIIVSSRVFISNAKGYPVLTKTLQELLFLYFKKHPFIIIDEDEEHVNTNQFNGGRESFLLYLRHLYSVMPEPSVIEEFAAGYMDYLQQPLQPLFDNLESSTYEVFERDPIKYNQYEKAIYAALLDRSSKNLKIAVVGAGRGPLVDRAIKAAVTADRIVEIYALEKNPSAYLYLCNRKVHQWNDQVTVVQGDMRSWNAINPSTGEKLVFNIIVSELLGSFGDNELSPECLDGVQHLLDPINGIMIPSNYSSHITPIMSPKLYTNAWATTATTTSSMAKKGSLGGTSPITTNQPGSINGPGYSLHTPYVVMLEQADYVSDIIKPIWQFNHPTKSILSSNQHNVRKCKESFPVPYKSVINGFAGYFEAILYKDIGLSTRPDTIDIKSKDMVSWFPMWFPLVQPMYVGDNCQVDISIWRLTDGRKVWYEWCIETFAIVEQPSISEFSSSSSLSTNINANHESVRSTSSSTGQVRRIRNGISELHNSGGRHFAMIL